MAGQTPTAGWCFALAAVRSTRKFLTTRTTRSSLILPGLCRRGRTIRHPNQMPDARLKRDVALSKSTLELMRMLRDNESAPDL